MFLLDENVDPKVKTYLAKEGIDAEHVRDTLGQGADDEDDLLPYAREYGRIIVTSDVTDFAPLSTDAHAGIVLLYDDTLPAYDVAAGLIRLVDTYPDRGSFADREILDDWV
jgi:predicted nuclease of predicted toxin-antitoxin system